MDNGAISVMMHHLVMMKLMLFVINLVGVELVTTLVVKMIGLYLCYYYTFYLKINFSYIKDHAPTSLSYLSCAISEYLNIFQCDYSTTSSSLCTDDTDVSVICCKLIHDNHFSSFQKLTLHGFPVPETCLVGSMCF